MVPVVRPTLICALCLLASCHPALPPGPIDPTLASYIPAGTMALGGVNLQQLRASPWYPRLPRAVTALVEPYGTARSLLAAYSGNDLLLVSSGPSLTGSPAAMRAAQAQHRTGTTGAPDLLAQAQTVAAGNQIWVVVRGDAALPLTGNAANVNRLLRNMEFAAITVGVHATIEFAVTARGRTSDAARRFEETLRATLTMTTAAEAKNANLAALLRTIQVRRDDRMVHATLSTNTETARQLLEMLLP
ncbi:MAG: hypothetical protein P4L56_24005 [Candidatus Sulfopaludibacter sp.]|nr:hypothetical protein [Candidatus Sulfopaludibacter sp.]